MAVAAVLHALGRQAPAQLGDNAMDRRQVGQRAGGQSPIELAQWTRRRQAARALDLRALELAAQQRLEAAQRVARQAVMARVLRRQLGLWLGAQAERAADALDVHADHPRALLAAGEGRDRHPREVAHGALRAVAQGRRYLRAQLPQLLLGELAERRQLLLADALVRGRELDGAEEEAVEHELEHAAVLLALGERRRQRLPEVLLGGPADLAQDLEGVEHLRRAHRHAFAAQLLAQLQYARRQALRRSLRRHRRASAASGRRARPPRPCPSGA